MYGLTNPLIYCSFVDNLGVIITANTGPYNRSDNRSV